MNLHQESNLNWLKDSQTIPDLLPAEEVFAGSVWALSICSIPCYNTQSLSIVANPGTAADDSSYGGALNSWFSPNNVTSGPDGALSFGILAGASPTHYLKITNFNFGIPDDSTITGITLDVYKKDVGLIGGHSVKDDVIKLVVGGSVVGNNKAIVTDWPTVTAGFSYGGPGDTWGLSPTAAEINASNFGAVLAATTGSGTTGSPAVDYMRITIYYTSCVEVDKRTPVQQKPKMWCPGIHSHHPLANQLCLALPLWDNVNQYEFPIHERGDPFTVTFDTSLNPCVLTGANLAALSTLLWYWKSDDGHDSNGCAAIDSTASSSTGSFYLWMNQDADYATADFWIKFGNGFTSTSSSFEVLVNDVSQGVITVPLGSGWYKWSNYYSAIYLEGPVSAVDPGWNKIQFKFTDFSGASSGQVAVEIDDIAVSAMANIMGADYTHQPLQDLSGNNLYVEYDVTSHFKAWDETEQGPTIYKWGGNSGADGNENYPGQLNYLTASGNGGFNGQSGTISLWFRWDRNDVAQVGQTPQGAILFETSDGLYMTRSLVAWNDDYTTDCISDPDYCVIRWESLLYSKGVIGLNRWRHVVVTWMPGEHKLYVDGQLEDEGAYTVSYNNNLSEEAFIGYGLNGNIGQVLCWNRVLTETEVKDLHDNPWELFDPEYEVNPSPMPEIYTPTGGIEFGGEALLLTFPTVGPGGIEFGGEGLVGPFVPTITGGIEFGGEAVVNSLPTIFGTGGIEFGGTAIIGPLTHTGSGGIEFGGAAYHELYFADDEARCVIIYETSEGGIEFGGTAIVVYTSPTGGIEFGGHAIIYSNLFGHEFEAIYHLKEQGLGESGEFEDSSPHEFDGRGGGGRVEKTPTRTGGLFYNSNRFGGNHYIEIPQFTRDDFTPITITTWFKNEGQFTNRILYSIGRTDFTTQSWQIALGHTPSNQLWARIQVIDENDEWQLYNVLGATTMLDDCWNYCGVIWTPGSDISVYLNGELDGTTEITETQLVPNIDSGSFIGRLEDRYYMAGKQQELRISGEIRSEAWLQAEFDAINDPDGFMTIGGEY